MPTAGSDQALADELSRLARIVILDQEKCQPNMPAYDYLRKNARIGCTKVPACIQVEDGKCVVLEDSCPTCLNRAKRCPGGAVRVVNLPHSLAPAVTHRFGQNAFKLHRLPVPRANQVLGLVGTNGIGKSTSLQVLAGRLKPNLGRYEAPAEWDDVLTYFKGSELQGYFTRMLDQGQTAVTKLQYVDLLPQALAPLGLSVRELLAAKDGRGALGKVVEQLELAPVLGRRVEQLSGGELQRLALALALLQRADVYVFDEPSSYLDVAQRLRAARAIRALLSPDTCVGARRPHRPRGRLPHYHLPRRLRHHHRRPRLHHHRLHRRPLHLHHHHRAAARPPGCTAEERPIGPRAPRPPPPFRAGAVAVEHDLSLLDYLSDSVALLYGARGAYGIVAPPLGEPAAFKSASTLFEDRAPSASLDCLMARAAAPTRPRAPPEPLGS